MQITSITIPVDRFESQDALNTIVTAAHNYGVSVQSKIVRKSFGRSRESLVLAESPFTRAEGYELMLWLADFFRII